MSNGDEKQQAFQGLCSMIPHNPMGITEAFPQFCQALLSYKNPPADLEKQFQNLMKTYKQCIGQASWDQYLHTFPESIRK